MHFTSYKEYKKDTRSSKKDDGFPNALPRSLEDALMCFILAVAVRESRKPAMIKSVLYQPHNTMLIHISRFTAWQNATKSLILDYLKDLEPRVDNDSMTSPNSIYSLLEKKWYKYYAEVIESIRRYLPSTYSDEFMIPISFESLKPYFSDIVKSLDVIAVNSSTGDQLVYHKMSPRNVIAIGGNRLSRGFTLEGLTINYFIRPTNYSDTLLQMGRWFGYRSGYLDTCKVFTTINSIRNFDTTTRCIEELEIEFDKMEKQRKTPESFVVRVRKHPGVLKITRPSILKNTIDVKWSFQDQLEMTTEFTVRKTKIEGVWDNFRHKIVPKLNNGEQIGDFIRCNYTISEVIDLLGSETNYSKEDSETMIQFLRLCKTKKLLENWTIALKTTGRSLERDGKGHLDPSVTGLKQAVGLAIRRGPAHSNSSSPARVEFIDNFKFKATGKSANILSSNKDMSLLLDDHEIKVAEEEFIKSKKLEIQHRYPGIGEEGIKGKRPKTFPGRIYRERMKESDGLIVIYLFDSFYSFNQEKGKEDSDFTDFVVKNDINLDIPLVGMAIGFPPIENDPGGTYVQGDYDLNIDEGYSNDLDPEDSILPVEEE